MTIESMKTISMPLDLFHRELAEQRDMARRLAYMNVIDYINGVGGYGYTKEWDELRELIDGRQLAEAQEEQFA